MKSVRQSALGCSQNQKVFYAIPKIERKQTVFVRAINNAVVVVANPVTLLA
jgi:hypothetical protein